MKKQHLVNSKQLIYNLYFCNFLIEPGVVLMPLALTAYGQYFIFDLRY